MIYFGNKRVSWLAPYQNIVGLQMGPITNLRYTTMNHNLVLKYNDPDDTYVDDKLVSKFLSTTLVYKRYPLFNKDGTKVVPTGGMYPKTVEDHYTSDTDETTHIEIKTGFVNWKKVGQPEDTSAINQIAKDITYTTDTTVYVALPDGTTEYYTATTDTATYTDLIIEVSNKEEDDGISFNSTIRNAYSRNTFVKTLKPGFLYCFRFFTKSTTGAEQTDDKTLMLNSFYNTTTTWDNIVELLEDFEHNFSEDESKSLLVYPGGEAHVEYIYDFRSNGSLKNTRADVDSVLNGDGSNMFPTLNMPFVVLGYNGNVPEYVKYRCKLPDGSYDRIYISSLDDTTTDFYFRESPTSTVIKKAVLTGDLCYRAHEQYSAGILRVYRKSYNPETLKNEFIFTETFTSSTSYDEEGGYFTYGSATPYQGSFNPVSVPRKIVYQGKEYVFAGYNMTIQTKCCVNDYSTGSNTTTMQFDNSEMTYGVAGNVFELGKDYYYPTTEIVSTGTEETVYNKIDTTNLIGQLTDKITIDNVEYSPIYVMNEKGALELDTQYYVGTDAYYIATPTVTDPDVVTVYKPYTTYAVGDYVYFNGILYKALKAMTTSNAITPRDSGYWAIQCTTTAATKIQEFFTKTAYAAGSYVWYKTSTGDEKIYLVNTATNTSYASNPEDDTTTFTESAQPANSVIVNKPIDDITMLKYNLNVDKINDGNNIWIESFIRQWMNSHKGSRDSWWKPMNKWDVQSMSGLGITNGFMLRFARTQDFLRNISPVANITRYNNIVVSRKWVPYKTIGQSPNSTVVVDNFWLTSMRELNFSDGSFTDANAIYSSVYPDNASRVKGVMNGGTLAGVFSGAVNWWSRSVFVRSSCTHWYTILSGGCEGSVYGYSGSDQFFGVAAACLIG